MTKQNNKTSLTLGCGLIRIGRVWGVDNKPVPTEHAVQDFLEGAFELGIRFFDTAPAYGLSEARLGAFLQNLTNEQRQHVTVATKFGEHWNGELQNTFVDHSYDALQHSLENSLKLLEKIDVLQLHKASTEVLDSSDVLKAFDHAVNTGVSFLGASISDVETGLKACLDKRFTYLQLPFNEEKTDLLPIVEQAKINQKLVLFNRPFAMGAIAKHSSDKIEAESKMITAYKRILDLDCPGIVLTGTASLEHLGQNMKNFERARHD